MISKKGFTLVELLVVIAIIALLMSILMPALARVRIQAKTVLCQTKLKQWGGCLEMYAGDNNGIFMEGWNEGSHPVEPKDFWMECLRPYYKDPDLRMCPSTTKTGTEVGGGPYGGWGTLVAWGTFPGEEGEIFSEWPCVISGDYGSYGNNGFICSPAQGVQIIQDSPVEYFWRRADVANTGAIPMFMDCQWLDARPRHSDTPPNFDGEPWNIDHYNQMNRICMSRHQGHINIIYMDHSVRPVGLRALWKQKWHRQFDLQNDWTEEGGCSITDWPEWLRDFPD